MCIENRNIFTSTRASISRHSPILHLIPHPLLSSEVLCDTSTTVRLALSSFRDFRMMPSFPRIRLEVDRPEGYQRGSFHYGVLMPDKVFQKRRLGSGFPFSSSAFTQRFLGPHTREQFFPPVLCRTVPKLAVLFFT